MLTVKIETDNPERLIEVRNYYEQGEGMNHPLDKVYKAMSAWFSPYGPYRGYMTGRGGSHVWLADETGKRVLCIIEH